MGRNRRTLYDIEYSIQFRNERASSLSGLGILEKSLQGRLSPSGYKNSSLYSLERTLSSGVKRRIPQRLRSGIFDTGEVVTLHGASFSESEQSQWSSGREAEAFTQDEAMHYVVESFEDSAEVASQQPDEETLINQSKENDSNRMDSISADETQQNSSVTAERPDSGPLIDTPSKDTSENQLTVSPPPSAAQRNPDAASEAKIIALAQEAIRRSSPAVSTVPEKQSAERATDDAETHSTGSPSATHDYVGHGVFDEIAKNLTYANSFDLGGIELNRRFEAFDRELTPSIPTPHRSSGMNAFVPEIDDASIAADLAEADLRRSRQNAVSAFTETNAPVATPVSGTEVKPSIPTVTHQDIASTKASSTQETSNRGARPVKMLRCGNGVSAAAAAAGMLVAWRHGLPADVEAARSGTGGWQAYREAFTKTDTREMLSEFGLTIHENGPLNTENLAQLFSEHGPLWIGKSAANAPAGVITEANGTDFTLVLPSEGSTESVTFERLNEILNASGGASEQMITAYL